ncbi:hypothetical protein RHSIM_Rhsim10G0135400 [Rhododendron simsii]|uniref:DUF4283 domain-containing protein n=1 Tax=Rhododendron simsii TaxID=118357 RepID=A0A834LDY0_RHOSS|nr:hypothetical protein RHSIM_Rhsim10G0135400 [Rhododendron simsii]
MNHQNLYGRSPLRAADPVYQPGMGARQLTWYMHQQLQRPKDNNIEFWRNFVTEFFALNAKKRWCVSLYGSSHQTSGVIPQDTWHCEICNIKPSSGFGGFVCAIYEMNGMTIRGHKLHVKIASFPWKGNEDKLKLRSSQNVNVKKPTQFVAVSSKVELSKEAPVIGVVSYAEIVGGSRNNNATLCRDIAADPNRDSGRSSTPLIEVNETDTEWLGLCAVGKLLHYHDNSFIQDLFITHGIWDAQIRSLGGLNTLISFESQESLEEFLSLKNVWKQWFSDINKWNGMDFIPLRCVWLSCLGVPPNIWNNQVFTSIGNLWGEVIRIDELTANSLAFDKGRVFIVTESHCMDSNELEENVQSKDGVEENEGRDLVKNIQSKENGYSDSESMNAGDESKIDGSPSGCELSPVTELQDGINDCANSYVGERVVEETTADLLPRLYQIKYDSGTLEELLYVDMPHEYQNPSGHIILLYAKAIQQYIFEQLSIVRDGQLRIVFTPDLKIYSWEFCARNHEERIPRRIIIPQIGQLGEAAQKYQAAAQNTTSSIPTQELQSNCNTFVTSAHQLAKALEVPVVNDLGYPKRYVRCLQISEVVNCMTDLIDYSRENGTGATESLGKFTQRTSLSSQLHVSGQQTEAWHELILGENINNDCNSVPSTSQQQLISGHNSTGNGNSVPANSVQLSTSNDVRAVYDSVGAATAIFNGLPLQNWTNSRNDNLMNYQIPSTGPSTRQPSSLLYPYARLSPPIQSSASNPPQVSQSSLPEAFPAPPPQTGENSSAHVQLQEQFSQSNEADLESMSSVEKIIREVMALPRFSGMDSTAGVVSVRNNQQNTNRITQLSSNSPSSGATNNNKMDRQ